MLFLAFLHKLSTNCKVRDYKTAPFRIITYSVINYYLFIIHYYYLL